MKWVKTAVLEFWWDGWWEEGKNIQNLQIIEKYVILNMYLHFSMVIRDRLIENIIKEYTLIFDLTPSQQHALMEKIPSLTDSDLMAEMDHIAEYYRSVKNIYQRGLLSLVKTTEQIERDSEQTILSSTLLSF